MADPFFSIITVCLNAQDTINMTISSILSQNFDNYEIIIKDGLSTDNTLQSIPLNEKIRIIEQKDSGIYDAMNQAISHVQGQYIIFLNCGDYFADNSVLEKVYTTAGSLDNRNVIIYGDYSKSKVIYKQPRTITKFYLFRTPICHQTMFFSTQLFNLNGNHNLKYKISADYDFTLKSFFNNAEFVYCPVVICDYQGNGFSENKTTSSLLKNEHKVITKHYYSTINWIIYNFILFFSMRQLRGYIVSDKTPLFIRKLYRLIVNQINNH